MTDEALEQLIAKEKLLSRAKLTEATQIATGFGYSLATVLVDRGYLPKATLGEALASHYGVDYVDWEDRQVDRTALALIPEETAVAKQLMPLAVTGSVLDVAFANPQDFELRNFLEKKTSYQIRPFFSFPDDLARGYIQYKGNLQEDFAKILKEGLPTTTSDVDLGKLAQDIPVVKALDSILQHAIAERASDVHVEGQESAALIRLRMDGILHDVLTLPKSAQAALVARVKILANLKIDEHRLPQDGRFKVSMLGSDVALRVSIIPGFYGENVVLRLLFESEKPKSLLELGLTKEQATVIEGNIKKSHGMILVTGPTGSGKTTTLYSVLNLLNNPGVKLVTVEDPIEYGIARISQIQVNPLTGLDFATGLRALLRHDPDIIMVGEIRDRETTTTAIQAALTGHLVLSTLHTNDAPSAVPRLLDLGSEPFLLASTLELVAAQRLVRRLCPDCRTKAPLEDPVLLGEVAELAEIALAQLKQQSFWTAPGCSACRQTGYQGRLGIYELFTISPKVQELIRTRQPAEVLRQAAKDEGMVTMFADGVKKAAEGLTSLEEVLRVSRE